MARSNRKTTILIAPNSFFVMDQNESIFMVFCGAFHTRRVFVIRSFWVWAENGLRDETKESWNELMGNFVKNENWTLNETFDNFNAHLIPAGNCFIRETSMNFASILLIHVQLVRFSKPITVIRWSSASFLVIYRKVLSSIINLSLVKFHNH